VRGKTKHWWRCATPHVDTDDRNLRAALCGNIDNAQQKSINARACTAISPELSLVHSMTIDF
jgi:hypothetical protein